MLAVSDVRVKTISKRSNKSIVLYDMIHTHLMVDPDILRDCNLKMKSTNVMVHWISSTKQLYLNVSEQNSKNGGIVRYDDRRLINSHLR